MNSLSEGLVLVTGGEGALGTGLQNTLGEKGLEVLCPGSTELDLRSTESIDKFCDNLGDKRVSGLVLNASRNQPDPLDSRSAVASIQEHMEINFIGHVKLLTNLLPKMCSDGGSRIVAVSSTYAEKARLARAPYSASKAALESFVRSVAIEYAQFGILANSVRPGFMDTPLTKRNNTEESIRTITSRIPISRLGTIHETADFISFLLSDENTYITGQTLAIDGGFSLT